MASSIFHILSLILYHLLTSTQPTSSVPIPKTGFRVPLTRVKKSGKTWPKYSSTNTLNNDPSPSFIQSPMKAYRDVYAMKLAIGTPPVIITSMMDTGSDLIWTKCKTTGSGLFVPSKSISFSKVHKSCYDFGLGTDCKQGYADGNSVSVSLGQETIIIGNANYKNVTFACGTPDNKFNYDGIVGMGRGALSLVSQLKESVFLYCLGSRFDAQTSSVLLTGDIASSQNVNTQSMPLLKQEGKSYYYISLEGISVGETKLAVSKSDFTISNGNGGMIIDSGTTFTYLEKSIVNMISNEFKNQTKLPKFVDHKPYEGLEHCFSDKFLKQKNVHVPNLVFHFEGADWVLFKENYIYEQKGMACLAFIANDNDVSIFGNMNQQNMMVVYNLAQNSLSFKPKNCNEL